MSANVCMYKGPVARPPKGSPAAAWRAFVLNTLGHWLVCALTLSRYSHIELEISGTCYSASFRDGGVRSRVILDLATSGRWALFPLQVDEAAALAQFTKDRGKPYDWVGTLRVCPAFRWMRRRDGARFCSEEVAAMLGATDPETFSPRAVLQRYVKGGG